MSQVSQIPPFVPPDEPPTVEELREFTDNRKSVRDANILTAEEQDGDQVGVYLFIFVPDDNIWRAIWQAEPGGWLLNQRSG